MLLAHGPGGASGTGAGTVAAAMTRILLVRHGESLWNAQGRWQGQADPPLSERGREQAAAAAAAIGTVDAIVASDLERAADTAAIMARRLGIEPVVTEPRLRERDAGPLSGLTRPEVHETFPGLLPDDPAGFTPGPDGQPIWPDGWERDPELMERVEVALVAIGRLVGDGDVVAVTHGGVMYAVERHLGAPDRGRLSNLGAVWLSIEGDAMRIGERLDLIDPATTLAIEADRI
jgi:probable phosphoglycerate mutase